MSEDVEHASTTKTWTALSVDALRIAISEQSQAMRCVALAVLYGRTGQHEKVTPQIEEALSHLAEVEKWADRAAVVAENIRAD